MSDICWNLAQQCSEAKSNSWDLDRAIFRACHLPNDGPLHHADPVAEFLGDPLPGRSALDKRRAAPEVRSISLAGGGL